MKRRVRVVWILSGVVLFMGGSSSAWAESSPASAATDPTLIQSFLQISGIEEQLGIVLSQMQKGVLQQLPQKPVSSSLEVDAQLRARVGAAAQDSFRLDVALPAAEAVIQSNFDVRHFAAAQQQLATPALRRVVQQEIESTKGMAADLREFINQAQQSSRLIPHG